MADQQPRKTNPFKALLSGVMQNLGAGSKADTIPALDQSERIDGKTCLVTGANTGLGKAIAIQLAQRGGKVIMACRSGIPEAGKDVKRISGNSNVEMIAVDLSDLNSVREMCDSLKKQNRSLDIVVLNAGLATNRAQKSKQGYELMFAVNYLANHLLTLSLLRNGCIPNQAFSDNNERTNKAPVNSDNPARIIFVSSEAHRNAPPINFDEFGKFIPYEPKDALNRYGQSKLPTTAFAIELGRRLCKTTGDDSDSVDFLHKTIDVAVHALCPGPVNSDIARDVSSWMKPIVKLMMGIFFKSPEKAAEPVVYLACADSVKQSTGLYLHMTQKKTASENAIDPIAGQRLWEAGGVMIEAIL